MNFQKNKFQKAGFQDNMAYCIPYGIFDGQVNMDTDKNLLDMAMERSLSPILRFYGWQTPTVTIGRNQADSCVNTCYCKSNNINIIKRITGGRAVLHHQELTYSFICPKDFLKHGSSVINSYKEISQGLVQGFKEFGIELDYPEHKKVFPDNGYCMAVSTGSDLSWRGKKLIGSAQCRKNDYILQHGSILFNLDKELLTGIFNSGEVCGEVTTLNEINKEITLNQVVNSIKSGFEKHFSIKFQDVSFFKDSG